jgi:hypothetical protein
MNITWRRRIALSALVLGSITLGSMQAYAKEKRPVIKHVLLISIDGMHAIDYLNCSAGLASINSGKPYCPNLKALGATATNFLNAQTSRPSDSFPGLMSIMTGATPRTMGVNYDVAYDRALNPPQTTSSNGNPGSGPTCASSPVGTTTEYDEGIDNNKNRLDAGATGGDPTGFDAIDSDFLVRDANCDPVYPWNFVRVNTIYGVIHAARGYTAWSDKHVSYSSVGGPTGTTTNSNVDDYYGPEINSEVENFSEAPKQLLLPECSVGGTPTLPDQTEVTANPTDDYTGSFQNIQCYDGLKANAIINEIKGMNHNGTTKTKVPEIFGMNFQAVSIGQKLIYQYPTPSTAMVATGYSVKGGYVDSTGTPSASLTQEIEFVDTQIGAMVTELTSQKLIDSTLIIVTAKHGQSPVDSSRYEADGSDDPATLLSSFLAPSETSAIGPTEDDVALLWLANSSDTPTAVSMLESMSPPSNNIAGIGQIFSGPSIGLFYSPTDSRAPDILITPNIGVTYSGSKKKLAEHGGFAHDDTNVILLVSNPDFSELTQTMPVQTAQIAPTILEALRLEPSKLQAVVEEGTSELPGLDL